DLAGNLGADAVWVAEDDIATLAKARWGDGPDVVVDCSGAESAIAQGIGLLPKGGRFIALGITGRPQIAFPFDRALLKVLVVVFSCTRSHGAWVHVGGDLARRHRDLARLISLRLPLASWRDAFAALERREAVKALLVP